MKKAVSMLLVVIYALLLSVTAFAKSEQQLIIDYSTENGALENAEFSVYRLGDVSGEKIRPTEIFGNYSVSFDISDSDKLSSLALTLSAYAQRDKLTPDYTDFTDKNGIADFDGEKFPDGAYLYIGKKHFQYDNIYFCEAAIVILPYGEGESVTTKPKYESVPETTDSITISYKVLKAWYADDINTRPAYIEAQLLRDGEIYDTVILNDENNWRYQWDNLSSRYQWLVTEKIVSEGYVVALTKNEKTFLLKNSDSDGENSSSPVIESTTASDGTTEPDSTTDVATTKESDGGSDLPQTGALKWPVPYLACIGMILFIAGYVTCRKSELTDEEK